jgi:hypothetical protein
MISPLHGKIDENFQKYTCIINPFQIVQTADMELYFYTYNFLSTQIKTKEQNHA